MQAMGTLKINTNVRVQRAAAGTVARSNLIVGVLLVFTMLIGGYFRFGGLNWDDFTHLHPDERFLTDVAQGLGRQLNPSGGEIEVATQLETCRARYPDTGGVGGYFDALCSTLNPLNANSGHGLYVYGTLPLFIARGSAELYAVGTEWYAVNILNQTDYDGSFWVTYDGVHLVWRMMSALAEMGIILLVFAMGVRLHDKWVGLLAAFLYATTVFSIQIAHFGTVDAIANFFATLTVMASVQVYRSGKFWTYLLFGFAFGCAIASRINLLPLVGLLVVAAALHILPALTGGGSMRERDRLVIRHLLWGMVALVLAVLCFRVFNPYAFDGPGFFDVFKSNVPFVALHDRWLGNMGTAQALVSGSADSPPNFQWTARTPWLFPMNNMILWGMGLPLGIVAWGAFVWAIWRILRGKPGALANILLVGWIAVYFGYLGRSWVTTMRYFLPVYGPLVVLAAWALVGCWRWLGARPAFVRWVVRVALVIVPAFTLLWAGMFTNIYRHLLTRVAASYWFMESVPGDFAMQIEGAPEGTPLINIPIGHRDGDAPIETRASRLDTATPRVAYRFTAPASGAVSHIHAPHLGDPNDDPEPETLQFTIQRTADMAVIALAELSRDFPRQNHVLGDAYDIEFIEPLVVEAGQEYEFVVQLVAGDALISGGSVVTWEGAWDDPVPTGVCAFPEGITLADDPPPGLVWDARECRRQSAGYGLVIGYKQDIVYEDEPIKRVNLLETLHYSDYLVISSNRFYDTLSRNPQRWPMTNAYYDKLFAGELGFELVEVFDSTYELGPLRVSDQHLPFYDSPAWLNEFEAEEAFHVYDHPAVLIYRKTADYDHSAVSDFLYSIPVARVDSAPVFNSCTGSDKFYCDPTLVNVATLSSERAAVAPTQLRLTDETRPIQYEGGTWSERFNSQSLVNLEPVVTVGAWWVVIFLFGWAAFPALYVLLPGLPGRGYAFAKFAGLFLVGYGLWVLASLRLPVWSQMGVAAGLLVLVLISIALVWRARDEFGAYVRANAGRMLVIEVLTLAAFLAWVAVRLTNPDLWHPSFGGEKPMDFAYFNAVLRSTIFPPYDPWFADGFLNYYYFGYVIVGSPVLLLKMVPSIAYNLIIPTLFALTGIGAFGVAFDIVSALKTHTTKLKVNASPMLAGIAALILVVVLGNLDTPRVFLTGVARLGGYTQPTGIQDFLVREYTRDNGGAPDSVAQMDILERANNPSVVDEIRYELNNSVTLLTSLAGGIGSAVNGQPLPIGTDRWFWAPSRVLAETPGVEGGAITEMPIFTFIYGDLHAHMIAMPMQLFIIGLLFNELLVAGKRRRQAEGETRGERGFFRNVLAVALIGVTVGMLRATNTWDWITYLLLGTVAMMIAWWLAQGMRVGTAGIFRRFTRLSILSFIGTVGGYLVFSFVGVLPYTTWYTAIYNSIRPWTDGKTPLWAFFDIHGLFLFLIVSLLLWETARWLRSVYVRELRGRLFWMIAAGILVIGTLLVSLGLALREWQVSLVVIPLLLWTAVVFFRPGQSRPMQFVLLLIGLSLGLLLGVEYIVLDGDIGRQNTVFKFYLQAWIMLSVVGGAVVAWLSSALARWRPTLQGVWLTIASLLLFIALLFPVMAIRARAAFRFDTAQPLTLDGMQYMNYARHYEGDNLILATNPSRAPFSLAEDYRMIRWLQESLQGVPTIIEGLSSDTQYKWNGRIAINTGLPAVIGWNFHQRQQRTLEPMGRIVEMRNANVNAFYQLPSVRMAIEMITFYKVEYIIVGQLELAYYAPEGLAKFDQMVELGLLDVVYQDGESLIYHVIPGAELREFG